MISCVYSKKGEKILVNNEAVWKQAMEEIIPGIPAFLAFVIVLALEIVLVNKKIIGSGTEKKIQKAKEAGQYVEAKIMDSRRSRFYQEESGSEPVRYSYAINGGRKRVKIVEFRVDGRAIFPETIRIYYWGNKVYTDYDKPKVVPNLLFVVFPFAAAILVLLLTHPELVH